MSDSFSIISGVLVPLGITRSKYCFLGGLLAFVIPPVDNTRAYLVTTSVKFLVL